VVLTSQSLSWQQVNPALAKFLRLGNLVDIEILPGTAVHAFILGIVYLESTKA